jgi:NTE family protein
VTDAPELPVGLALGSGVARGWAHIGVLRGLDRAGIRPGIVCGTSIGALAGAFHLAGRLDALEGWARQINKLRLTRLFDFQLGHGGIIAGRRVRQLLDSELGGRLIEDLPARFACVTTEYGTGHEVWLQRGDIVGAVRASYALPGLLPPIKVDGRWLLDGALVNPVPVSVCRALGARVVIAVNLNADAFDAGLPHHDNGDALDETAITGPLGALPGAARMRQLFQRRNDEPSVFGVLSSALNIVQHRLGRLRLAGDPPDVTIAPQLADIGLMDFHRAGESIAAGERAVEKALPVFREAMRRVAGQSPATAEPDRRTRQRRSPMKEASAET